MSEAERFSCCLVGEGKLLAECAEVLRARGHDVVAVISSEPSVIRWCETSRVPRAPWACDRLAFLGTVAFDYLFSVVNHRVLDAEVLRLARRGAVNYHDSPLPAYAGFNVTSWAIANGETSHGVTWHEMSERVDSGRISKQRRFALAPDETAFSLAARCHAVALETFAELIDELSTHRVDAREQGAEGRTYFGRHARPASVLDFTKPAAELARLLRALDTGPEDSFLGVPKLAATNLFYLLKEARAAPASKLGAAPSTIVAIDANAIRVATGEGELRLLQVAALDGTPRSLAELVSEAKLHVGARLERPPLDAIATFDAEIARHEGFFVERLKSSVPAAFLDVRGATATAIEVEEADFDVPSLHARAADADFAMLVFAIFVRRCGVGDVEDIGFDDRTALIEGPFVHQVPFRIGWKRDERSDTALDEARAELAELRQRRAFAADVWERHAALRELPRLGLSRGYPIVIRREGFDSAFLPGTILELTFVGGRVHARFDGRMLAPLDVRRLGARFEAFVQAALAAPETPLDRLPIVPESERRLLLEGWNATKRDVPVRCVHEFFERQVVETPEAVAVVFRDRRLTYHELNERANAVAHRLMREHVGPDVLVGIYLERSIDMLVAMLAVLKAGGAYVPLDPGYPAERLGWMLEDCRATVILTSARLCATLPHHSATVVDVTGAELGGSSHENPRTAVRPEHLAYVIFTSGSTGRPKGVMIEHRNVANFFAGMDERVGTTARSGKQPAWLAVTSMSFDIHVLELLWTLARGFKVVLAEEQSAARTRTASVSRKMDFSLFYFASDAAGAGAERYRLLTEGAKFADEHDFAAVWTPERHFHAFGGLYPNPSVTSAALAVLTKRTQIRAGSVVLPLHNPVRVAEEWSVVDNLSGGRVGLSFASGWHASDFALAPDHYADRKERMFLGIETIRKLWRGESIDATSGDGKPIQIRIQPLPVRARPPIWITTAGNVGTFRAAGEQGFNLLTNLLGQSVRELSEKIAAYRDAYRHAGHPGEGIVTVMLHAFVTSDASLARATVYEPFSNYLKTSVDLIKMAPSAFPAFRQPSKAASGDTALDPSSFGDEDLKALVDHAFERYFETAGLFGTPGSCLGMVERLREVGVNELACLVDFGVEPDIVLANLVHLDRLRERANAEPAVGGGDEYSIASQTVEHGVTHLQCTPSLARMMLAMPEMRAALRALDVVLLGGEPLPAGLAEQVLKGFDGRLVNMYGPTETTVWSTTSEVARGDSDVTIGRPIANTEMFLLDRAHELVPIGMPGELFIGGAGVARGYLNRPDLTRERFVEHPLVPGARLYRTGDSGALPGLGRPRIFGSERPSGQASRLPDRARGDRDRAREARGRRRRRGRRTRDEFDGTRARRVLGAARGVPRQRHRRLARDLGRDLPAKRRTAEHGAQPRRVEQHLHGRAGCRSGDAGVGRSHRRRHPRARAAAGARSRLRHRAPIAPRRVRVRALHRRGLLGSGALARAGGSGAPRARGRDAPPGRGARAPRVRALRHDRPQLGRPVFPERRISGGRARSAGVDVHPRRQHLRRGRPAPRLVAGVLHVGRALPGERRAHGRRAARARAEA